MNKKNRNTILFFICSLVSLLTLLSTFILRNIELKNINSIYSHYLVVIVFILAIWIWNRYYADSIVNPVNLLLYAQFIFLGSNSLLKIFDIESKDFFIGFPLNNADYIVTNAIIILSVMFFLFGAIASQSKNKKSSFTFSINKQISDYNLDFSGLLLLAIGLIAFFIDFDFTWLTSAYKEFGETSLWRLIWTITLPIAGFILISSKNKSLKRTGIITILLLSFIYILMGNRGYSISLFLVLLWLYNINYKKIRNIQFIMISIILIFIINVFFQMKTLSVIEKLSSFQELVFSENSPLVSLLQEGSVTYRTLIYTIKYIPDIKSFQLGASYFWAITTILPNIFGLPTHPSLYYYNGPSEWLRWTFSPIQASLGQGFGYSTVGEAYFNFGIIGVAIILFLIGYFFSKLSNSGKLVKNRTNIIILSIVLNNIIWGTRNPLSSIIRDIVWQIILLILITNIIKYLSKINS